MIYSLLFKCTIIQAVAGIINFLKDQQQQHYRMVSNILLSSLLFFLTKKVTCLPAGRQRSQGKHDGSARFAFPPTCGVTGSGNIVCIRVVRKKDEYLQA